MIKHDPFIKSSLSFLLSTVGHLLNLLIVFPYLVGEDGMGRYNTQEPNAMAAIFFCTIVLLMLLGGWFLFCMLLARMAKWPIWPCVISLVLVIIGGWVRLRYFNG